MKGLRSLLLKRCIALGLLLSLLPMLVMPLPGAPHYNGAEHHIEWLKGQLKGHENEMVERAITIAQTKDAHNLQLFLEAFVEAYVEQQGALGVENEIKVVLSEMLRRHWTQLIGQGMVPYLTFKSLQVRTSVSRDRIPLVQLLLIKKQNTSPYAIARTLLADAWFSTLFITVHSTAVVPRGP